MGHGRNLYNSNKITGEKKIQEEIIQEVIKTGKLNPGEY